MLKIKSTIVPKDRTTIPHANPNMSYIIGYWSQPGNNFNYNLYLKVLMSKK